MSITVREEGRIVPEPAPRLLLRCLSLTLAAAITFQLFNLGAQPVAVGLIPAPWDKLAHFAVFSTLAGLLWIGTAGRMPLAVIAISVAIGALDELYQAGLPGRHASAIDFLTDACAAAVTIGVIALYRASRRKTRVVPPFPPRAGAAASFSPRRRAPRGRHGAGPPANSREA
jgi:VanZ family protein